MSNNQSAFLLLLFLLGDLAAFLTYLTGFILIVREDKREEEDRVDEAFWEA